MSLLSVVTADQHEAMDATIQAEYIVNKDGDEGTFILDVKPVGGLRLADVDKLQKALGSERDATKTLRDAAKVFEGLNADDAREAMEFKVKFDAGEMDDKSKALLDSHTKAVTDKFEKDRVQIAAKHTKDLADRDARLGQITGFLKSDRIQNAASQAIAKHKGSLDLLLPVVLAASRMVENDKGEFEIEIIGPDGLPQMTKQSGSTDHMAIDEFVELMSEDDRYKRAFDGEGSTGSGGRDQDPAQGGVSYKISTADAKDPAKYRAAKEAAAKVGRQLVITS